MLIPDQPAPAWSGNLDRNSKASKAISGFYEGSQYDHKEIAACRPCLGGNRFCSRIAVSERAFTQGVDVYLAFGEWQCIEKLRLLASDRGHAIYRNTANRRGGDMC